MRKKPIKKRKKNDKKSGGRKPQGLIDEDLKNLLIGLRLLRNKAGMNQSGLAKSGTISPRQLIKIEQGLAMPQLNEWFWMLKSLKTRLKELPPDIDPPALDPLRFKLGEILKVDPGRGKHLAFEIETHYEAAMDAVKKEADRQKKISASSQKGT